MSGETGLSSKFRRLAVTPAKREPREGAFVFLETRSVGS